MGYKKNAVVVIDFETTGLNPIEDHPIEVALKAVHVKDNLLLTEGYSEKIKLPKCVEVPKFITELTGLTTQEVNEGKDIKQVAKEIEGFIDENTVIVAHNSNFDLAFLFLHMGIKPTRHMCTRTISILTDPTKSASLKDVYARMIGKEKTQTHRASDDVDMTLAVFDAFLHIYGPAAILFFENLMVNMPDRELIYIPENAKVLDFTAKYKRKPKTVKHAVRRRDLPTLKPPYKVLKHVTNNYVQGEREVNAEKLG